MTVTKSVVFMPVCDTWKVNKNEMKCIFDASRKVIKNFDSKIKGTFLESC
jgi:3-methyladenine DNA glycosylase AlkC